MNVVLQARLEYRPMRADDVAAVVAIENRIYAFPWTAGNFADSFAAGHGAWVCHEAGAMVGYAVTMQVLDEAHLLTIGVAAARQRRGLGSALLAHLCAQAQAAGAARMFLDVRPSNQPALALYARFGFGEIGRRRGYYPGPDGREDAIVMARDL